MASKRRAPGIIGYAARGLGVLAVAVTLVFAGFFTLDSVGQPISTLMLERLATGRTYERDWVPLSAIAPVLIASVIASEDAKFCRNDGVDWESLHEVIDDADGDGPSRGASTITMQTVKNLFLWPGRSTLRKGIEIVIALALTKVWSKPHILEVYLNIAEWGDGLFGIEAAARHDFGKGARQLDAREAALLATSLPNPITRNAAHPRPFQRRLAASIVARARGSAEWLDCLPRASRYGG